MKDQLGDAPPSLAAVARLGATHLVISCPPPCRRQARVEIASLRLPDDMPFVEIAVARRFLCVACDRRAGRSAVSVDWNVDAARPGDGR